MKIFYYFKKLSLIDFLRKSACFFFTRNDNNLFRKIKSLYYFKTTSVILGKSIKIFGLPNKSHIGEKVRIYDNGIFEFGPDSIVFWGNNVLFSYGVVYCSRSKIQIGDDVQIGEYTSIRDTTHTYKDTTKTIRQSVDVSTPILIGNNVWIGRGCLIMPGTVIEDGVVVGANSIVKGLLKKNGIYAGSPCKFIKSRVSQNNY